jgi:hypothetical protein
MPFGIQISSTIKKLLQENIYVLVKEGRKKKKQRIEEAVENGQQSRQDSSQGTPKL